MDLQPHEQRVVLERDELDTKRRALETFLTSPMFYTLAQVERHLLHSQWRAMTVYCDILDQRIARFEPTGG